MISRYLWLSGLLLGQCAVLGAEYFVAPGGTATSPGSLEAPWSLAFGLSASNRAPQPGDTLWVRGGTYVAPSGGFLGKLSSAQANRPILVRNYNNERAIIDGAFNLEATNLWVWGLELTGTGASPSTGYGFVAGRNMKYINCLIYDSRSSGGFSQATESSEYYGTLIVRSGRYDGGSCFGNSLYSQNRTAATNRVLDCIVANGFLEGVNIYSGGTTPINNFHVEGSILFGNGHCAGRNFLVGSDIPAQNITVLSNVMWSPEGKDNLILCYGDAKAVAPVLRGNILHGNSILSGNTGAMEFVGNELYAGEFRVAWPRDRSPTAYLFDYNQYFRIHLDVRLHDNNGSYPASGAVNLGSSAAAFERFRTLYQTYGSVANFRPEEHGQHSTGLPATGARVVVRPNAYEPGRAHIAILNWARAATVAVDLAALGLSVGQEFELRAVQDYFGARFTGRYDGQPVAVPMTGWSVAQPRQPRVPLASTFPAFGAFVLIPLGVAPTNPPAAPASLQALGGDGEVRLSWPPVVGATGYRVKRASSSGGPYATLATVPSAPYQDTAVTNGAVYFYAVTAVNAAGESPASPQASAQPRAAAPPAPTGLAVVEGNGQASLRWIGSPKAAAYRVKRSTTGPSGSYATIATVATAAFTNFGLANGLTYYYVVSALNAVGESADSSSVRATPTELPVPLFHLDFNEPSGTAVVNHGSAGGTLAATTPNPRRSENVPSQVGGRGSMDFGVAAGNFGVDAAGIADGLRELSGFTLTGWINNKSSAQGAGGNRIVTWINAGGDGADLVYRSDGSLQLGVNSWPDSSPARSSPNRIPTDSQAGPANWRFFAVSYDSSLAAEQVKFYFGSSASEAALDLARSYPRGVAGPAIGPLTIGHFNPLTRPGALDRIFRGLIDEIKVFPRPLSLQEIRAAQHGGDLSNAPPSVSAIADQVTGLEQPIFSVPFTVGDDGLPLDRLGVSATSSNRKLMPDEYILIEGSGAQRSITLYSAPGQFGKTVVTLTVDDGQATASTSFVVWVRKVNQPPEVEAGADQTISLATRATLNGQVIDDGLPEDSAGLSFHWMKLFGPGTVRFGNSNALSTTASFSTSGLYVLQLAATDGEQTAADTVSVLVTPPSGSTPPVISAVQLLAVTASSVIISWTTDKPADSQVEFGPDPAYGRTSKLDSAPLTQHWVSLSGLSSGTGYHFRILARDSSGQLGHSADQTLRTAPGPDHRFVYTPATTAEAVVTPPMAFFPHMDTSTQRYLASPVAALGSAVIGFYLPAPGSYAVWGRVLASAATGNSSFFIAVDGGPEIVFEAPAPALPASWRWGRLSGRSGAGAVTYPRFLALYAGLHQVRVRARDANVGLDRLLLTNDPEFVPVDQEPVAGIATAQALSQTVVRFSVKPGLTFIANQFSRGNNTVSTVLPDVREGVEFYKLDPMTGATTLNRVVMGRWSDPGQPFLPGEGAVLSNLTPEPLTLTFTGASPGFSPSRQLEPGLHLLGCRQPFGGPLSHCLEAALSSGDRLFQYDTETGEFTTHTYLEAGWDVEPAVDVLESFYLEIQPRP